MSRVSKQAVSQLGFLPFKGVKLFDSIRGYFQKVTLRHSLKVEVLLIIILWLIGNLFLENVFCQENKTKDDFLFKQTGKCEKVASALDEMEMNWYRKSNINNVSKNKNSDSNFYSQRDKTSLLREKKSVTEKSEQKKDRKELVPQKESKVYRNPIESRGEKVMKALRCAAVKLYLEYRIVKGQQIFKVIDSGGKMISKLTYPIEGDMFVFNGEVRLHPRFSMGGEYGNSNLRKTINSDEDWDVGFIQPIGNVDYQITKQDCKSKLEFFDINLYYHFLDFDKSNEKTMRNKLFDILHTDRFFTDIFVGYQEEKGRYTMMDPLREWQLLDDGGGWWEVVGLPSDSGLESPYTVRYKGPRVGLRLGAVKEKFSSNLNLAYAQIETDANGYWNLRDYSFKQEGDNGYALNIAWEVLYHLNPNWFIGGGYSYMECKQEKLKESGVMPGYSYSDEDIIRDVNNRVYGPSFKVGYKW